MELPKSDIVFNHDWFYLLALQLKDCIWLKLILFGTTFSGTSRLPRKLISAYKQIVNKIEEIWRSKIRTPSTTNTNPNPGSWFLQAKQKLSCAIRVEVWRTGRWRTWRTRRRFWNFVCNPYFLWVEIAKLSPSPVDWTELALFSFDPPPPPTLERLFSSIFQ